MTVAFADLLRATRPQLDVFEAAVAQGLPTTLVLSHGTSTSIGDLDAGSFDEMPPASAIIWVHACDAGNDIAAALALQWAKSVVGFTRKVIHPLADTELDLFVSLLNGAVAKIGNQGAPVDLGSAKALLQEAGQQQIDTMAGILAGASLMQAAYSMVVHQ